MSGEVEQYIKYGVSAAKWSVLFPGLGQLRNRHYRKAMLVIGIASFLIGFQLMLLAQPQQQNRLAWSAVLFGGLFAIWELSIFDAYYSAVANRRADTSRQDVQILTTVYGVNVSNSSFQEIAVTKNVSKMGACLIMSTEVGPDTPLILEFEGKPRNKARVVWAKETGNCNERLVGVELKKPLRDA